MIKSQRFTSYRHNKSKHLTLNQVFEELTWLRDRMNDYIFDNLECLILSENILLKQYAQFTSNIIPAWNIQKEYQFLVQLYKNSIKRQLKNISIKIQSRVKISKYKKKTKHHNPGDTKEFKLVKKSTNLCRFLKFLIYTKESELNKVKNDWFKEALDFYRNKPYFNRILNLAKEIRNRSISGVKKLRFNNEAILRTHKSHSGIVVDNSNSLYKCWFFIRFKENKVIYLPLQINQDYHKLNDLIAKEFLIFRQGNKNKIHIVTTYKADDPQFISHSYRVEGLDINLKHNFAICSDGTEFDFDREFLKKQIEYLKKLDEIGYQNFNERQLKRLKKIYRRLVGYFNYLCSNILRKLANKGVTDLVVEDLLLRDKFGFSKEFGIKWIRLSKLLHLSNVKNTLVRIGEKLGIRIHITHSAYSSQQCPECGHIDRENRKTQEEFKCTKCEHEDNADHNASVNLRNRFLLDVLRESLHSKDAFGRLRPKKMSKFKLRSILEEFVSSRSLLVNGFG